MFDNDQESQLSAPYESERGQSCSFRPFAVQSGGADHNDIVVNLLNVVNSPHHLLENLFEVETWYTARQNQGTCLVMPGDPVEYESERQLSCRCWIHALKTHLSASTRPGNL